ncbi:MAG: hypothetical protein E6Q42_01545 [Dechloromonas sp.]|jgi:hypothetical protein|nr:hypothetical protein [Xanthomonadales bacterium]TXI79333.1 MAG: hypothetical protein E6Q42_01545 [Dechloromonas sp.]HRD73538.1 hypothetical protein [Aquimonas sp.]
MARLLRANQWATLLLGVLSCLAPGMSHGQAWEEMMEIRALSIEQRAALRQKAVSGDSDASYRLALLYGDYESYDFAQYFSFYCFPPSKELLRGAGLPQFAAWPGK